jgi:preprotein translocase subunit SecD
VSSRRIAPLFGVLLLTLAALYVVWPSEPEDFLPSGIPWPEGQGVNIGSFERETMRLGLDLQGGTRLLLRATPPEGFDGDIDDALDGTISVLRRRVDSTGVSEAEITKQGTENIAIQLPGLTPDEAQSLLGRTALLRFCEPATARIAELGACDAAGQWQQATGVVDGREIAVTGRFLRPNAFVSTDAIGNPAVAFETQNEGPQLFEQLTTRLLQQPMAAARARSPGSRWSALVSWSFN